MTLIGNAKFRSARKIDQPNVTVGTNDNDFPANKNEEMARNNGK